MGTQSRLGVLIGHMDLNLTSSLKTKKKPRYINLVISSRTLRCSLWGTWGVLAVVFVQLYQNWRRHHQELTQRHGDGVRHHRKPLTQATQALKTQTPMVKFQ